MTRQQHSQVTLPQHQEVRAELRDVKRLYRELVSQEDARAVIVDPIQALTRAPCRSVRREQPGSTPSLHGTSRRAGARAEAGREVAAA